MEQEQELLKKIRKEARKCFDAETTFPLLEFYKKNGGAETFTAKAIILLICLTEYDAIMANNKEKTMAYKKQDAEIKNTLDAMGKQARKDLETFVRYYSVLTTVVLWTGHARRLYFGESYKYLSLLQKYANIGRGSEFLQKDRAEMYGEFNKPEKREEKIQAKIEDIENQLTATQKRIKEVKDKDEKIQLLEKEQELLRILLESKSILLATMDETQRNFEIQLKVNKSVGEIFGGVRSINDVNKLEQEIKEQRDEVLESYGIYKNICSAISKWCKKKDCSEFIPFILETYLQDVKKDFLKDIAQTNVPDWVLFKFTFPTYQEAENVSSFLSEQVIMNLTRGDEILGEKIKQLIVLLK